MTRVISKSFIAAVTREAMPVTASLPPLPPSCNLLDVVREWKKIDRPKGSGAQAAILLGCLV